VSVTVAPSGPTGGSCEARLRLTISPRRFVRGRRTTFRVRVVAVLGSYRAPVPGATVTLAGHRALTSARGGARIRARLAGRRYTIRARAAGFTPGSARARSR
jgi:hypothetical protein